MKRADRQRWAAARTLRELGELTALWLEGKIASQPGYEPNCGPDPETMPLVPILAKLNRAGWLTEVSQPGWGPGLGDDGATWRQRAAVGGFAEPSLAERITRMALAVDLLVVSHIDAMRTPVWGSRRSGQIVVTQRDYQWHTAFGGALTRRDLRWRYDGCNEAALRELDAATQLTVINPEWGSKDRLWRALDTFC